MRLLLPALLLASPAGATPPPHPCADYQRLAAAAEEEVPFTSLAGTGLHGLLKGYCPVSNPAPRTLLCHRNLLPTHLTGRSVAENFRTCVPGSLVEQGKERRSWLVSHGRLRVEIRERGADRAHVGRSLSLYIRTEAESVIDGR